MLKKKKKKKKIFVKEATDIIRQDGIIIRPHHLSIR